jgi:hypothetical protein
MVAPSRSYRTYTYSEPGYRRLFDEAGFGVCDSYWAEPGYNQPYRLTPLDAESVTENLNENLFDPVSGHRRSLQSSVKRALSRAGMLKYIVPEFVFILRKAGQPATLNWDGILPDSFKVKPHLRLTTYQFAKKTTIRVSSDSQPGLVVKCSTPAPGSSDLLATEYGELDSMATAVAASPGGSPFAVPAPLGSRVVGANLMTAESRAPGEQLSLLLFRLSSAARLAFLRERLPALGEVGTTIVQQLLASSHQASAAPWLALAGPRLTPSGQARASKIDGLYAKWSAHGDLTIENIMFDAFASNGQTVTVIDWEFVRRGLPPLYDLFVLHLSILRAIPVPADVAASVRDPMLALFQTAFFHENEWSVLFKDNLRRECARLGVDPAQAHEMFVDSLIFRLGYLVERKVLALSANHVAFIDSALTWKDQFQV